MCQSWLIGGFKGKYCTMRIQSHGLGIIVPRIEQRNTEITEVLCVTCYQNEVMLQRSRRNQPICQAEWKACKLTSSSQHTPAVSDSLRHRQDAAAKTNIKFSSSQCAMLARRLLKGSRSMPLLISPTVIALRKRKSCACWSSQRSTRGSGRGRACSETRLVSSRNPRLTTGQLDDRVRGRAR